VLSAELLQHLPLMEMSERMQKVTYNTALAESFLAFFEKNEMKKPVFLQIYLLNISMLRNKEDENLYWKFKNLLLDNQSIFDEKEKSNLYRFATNYCTPRLNRGERTFVEEGFFWNTENIRKKYIFENGLLSPSFFKNTLRLGLSLLRYKSKAVSAWNPKKFIEDNIIYLPEKQQNTYSNLATGLVFFQEKKYTFALEKLKLFRAEDALHQLDAKRVLLAIYYETAEDELYQKAKEKLEIEIETQANIAEIYKIYNRNFIHFLEEIQIISQLKGNKNKAINILSEKIESEIKIADKDVLLEFLKNLKK
jgi:hypothetical protein